MPIKIADINNREKPINSIPIFNATNKEYKIAVVTPVHSKNLLFIKYNLEEDCLFVLFLPWKN